MQIASSTIDVHVWSHSKIQPNQWGTRQSVVIFGAPVQAAQANDERARSSDMRQSEDMPARGTERMETFNARARATQISPAITAL